MLETLFVFSNCILHFNYNNVMLYVDVTCTKIILISRGTSKETRRTSQPLRCCSWFITALLHPTSASGSLYRDFTADLEGDDTDVSLTLVITAAHRHAGSSGSGRWGRGITLNTSRCRNIIFMSSSLHLFHGFFSLGVKSSICE